MLGKHIIYMIKGQELMQPGVVLNDSPRLGHIEVTKWSFFILTCLQRTWLYFCLSGVSPSFGPTMTETALITLLTPLKYSGIRVLSLVMSPTIWEFYRKKIVTTDNVKCNKWNHNHNNQVRITQLISTKEIEEHGLLAHQVNVRA